MSEVKLISIFGFQDSLLSLERFVICDTSGIKSGTACSIFLKSCISDYSWARSRLHSDFWDLQNTRKDFSETNISVRKLKEFQGITFWHLYFCMIYKYIFSSIFLLTSWSRMTQRKANLTILILEPVFPSYIGNSHHHHISVNLLSPTITKLWSTTRDRIRT